MQVIVDDEKYGKVVYEENVFTGSKKLHINGRELDKTGKNTFKLRNADGTVSHVSVASNPAKGTKVCVENDSIPISSGAKWYEYALSVFIFVVIMVWGSSPSLCSIVPILGGAIGGAISGAMAYANLTYMGRVKKIGMKLLVFAVFFDCNNPRLLFTCSTFACSYPKIEFNV